MLKTSVFFLSLSAAFHLILASSVTLTSPEPNDVWKAGSTVQIKWKVNNETSGPIRLQYASGPSKELKINGVIADHVDAKLGKYSWKIPSGLKPKKYVIEAGPNAKDLSFAGYITVKGHTKTTKKHTTKKHTSKKTTKKPHSTKKHTTKKHTTKKHTTVTKKKTTKKVWRHPVKDHTSKKNTKKHTTAPVKEVCVGYPTRGEGNNTRKITCHPVTKVNRNIGHN